MDLRYLIMCLLNIVTPAWTYEGFYYRDAAGVGHYGLEGLSMDILEKIKRATGHPVDIDAFANILSAQSRSSRVKYRPYKKRGRKKKKERAGMEYQHLGGGKSSRTNSERFVETGKSGSSGKEMWAEVYGENSGSGGDFMKEAEFTDEHYHKEEEAGGEEYKGGKKHGRAFLSKGYEDVYHRDETKMADSFWDKEEKEGKWIRYGAKKRKEEKKAIGKKGERKREEEKEGGEYKSAKGSESERRRKKTTKKEERQTRTGEDKKTHREAK